MEQLGIAKVLKAQFDLDLKCLFGQTQTYLNVLAPQGQRKHVPDLGSPEPEGALVLSCPS